MEDLFAPLLSTESLIYGTPNDDRLLGNANPDGVFGYGGNDINIGYEASDVLFGNAGADALYGNESSDSLYGGEGNDSLYGGQENDVLFGDRADDVLSGDRGADSLTGGEGNDRFAIAPGMGGSTPEEADLITDYNPETDLIQLEGGLTFYDVELVLDGQETVIRDTISGEYLAVVSGFATGTIEVVDNDLTLIRLYPPAPEPEPELPEIDDSTDNPTPPETSPPTIPQEEFETTLRFNEQINEEIETQLESGMTIDQAIDEVRVILEDNPDQVQPDSIQESEEGLSWRTTEGILVVLDRDQWDYTGQRSGGNENNPTSNLSTTSTQNTTEECECADDALVLAPYAWQFEPYDEGDEIANLLRDAGIDVTEKRNATQNTGSVTIEDFKNLDRYGLIAISSHGGNFDGQIVVDTGETLTVEDYNQYGADVTAGRLVLDVGNHALITPSFVTYYTGEMSDSIVTISACSSTENNTLGNAFLDRGAASFIGFSDTVSSPFAYERSQRVFETLLQGNTTGEIPGINVDQETDEDPAVFQLIGSGDATLPVCECELTPPENPGEGTPPEPVEPQPEKLVPPDWTPFPIPTFPQYPIPGEPLFTGVDLYTFGYYYGTGDAYFGYTYAPSGSFFPGEFIPTFNQTGLVGSYYIDTVYPGWGDIFNNGDVYVTSYFDGDQTGWSYQPYNNYFGAPSGEFGLGSEYDYIYKPSFFGPYYDDFGFGYYIG